MNVRQLIEALSALENKEAEVLLEGCDCYGTWNGQIVSFQSDGGGDVLLRRDDADAQGRMDLWNPVTKEQVESEGEG